MNTIHHRLRMIMATGITISIVVSVMATRTVAENLDAVTPLCYIRVEGQTIQNLTNLCGHKPNSSGAANTGRKTAADSQSQPSISPTTSVTTTSSSAEACTGEDEPECLPFNQPTSIQIPPTHSTPSASFPPVTVPPDRSPAVLVKPPVSQHSTVSSTSIVPDKSNSRKPPISLPPNQSWKNDQLNKLSYTSKLSYPTKLQAKTPKSQTFTHRHPTSIPSSKSPVQGPARSPSLPQLPTVAPQPSIWNRLLQARYIYLFWLVCIQVPLLKVVTDKFSQSRTKALKPKISLFQSTWQQLKQVKSSYKQAVVASTLHQQSITNSNLALPHVKTLKSMNNTTQSAWQQLKQQKISCEQALELLVNQQGVVRLELLDREVSNRFLRNFPEKTGLPPVVPLLLWRNCYYLGSSGELSNQEVQKLKDRLNTAVKIIQIAARSFQHWRQVQSLEENLRTNGASFTNSPTDKLEPENITEVAEYHLSQVDNQVERLKALIASALRNRASDIHLAPAPDGLRVRFRIDGILRHVTTLPPDISRRAIVALKVMCDMDISESRRPQDGRISEKYISNQQEEGLDLRVSTVPCVGGVKGEASEKAVLRLLRQKNSFATINDLGFSVRACEIYKNWLKEPQGMVILTGPTGSGKTSTLYTSLQAISTEAVNIITVEDPVEYVLPGITQIQVHEAAGMTFAAGLRAILRQDPDVIMLGEIRDGETAETATRAALTGHLVLTTLHTNDAIGAIPRLKDMGLDPGLISDALLGVVAQRLVRRVCTQCSEPYEPTQSDLNMLGISLKETRRHSWRKGKGCAHCFNSGYLGREAIIELLCVDDTIRQIIHEGTVLQLHRYLNEIRYDSFRLAAISKVESGITTIEEIRRILPYSVLGQGLNLIHQDKP